MVPANGAPLTLAERVDHEALSYRERGDSFSQWIATHLENLAALVRWTHAETPEEHDARKEWWDDEARAKVYDRGYEAGLEAAVTMVNESFDRHMDR
jgi:hypothetical protein